MKLFVLSRRFFFSFFLVQDTGSATGSCLWGGISARTRQRCRRCASVRGAFGGAAPAGFPKRCQAVTKCHPHAAATLQPFISSSSCTAQAEGFVSPRPSCRGIPKPRLSTGLSPSPCLCDSRFSSCFASENVSHSFFTLYQLYSTWCSSP